MVPSSPRLVALLIGASLAGCSAAAAPSRPVVVELFESQGCSSCPPAAENLGMVRRQPNVIALTFHVTYWDGQAWKDSFASPAFTARQWDYAHDFGRAEVFTPEVVVNGRHDGVGVRQAQFSGLLAAGAADAPGPPLSLSDAAVTVGAGAKPTAPADIWLVHYDPRVLQIPIRGGENGGRTLPQYNVVRELVRIGGWNGGAETVKLPAATQPGLVTAVLIQAPHGGPILSATKS